MLQQFIHYSSGCPILVLILGEVSAQISRNPVSFRGGALPCDLTFLRDLVELLIFHFVQAFNLLLGWSGDF